MFSVTARHSMDPSNAFYCEDRAGLYSLKYDDVAHRIRQQINRIRTYNK